VASTTPSGFIELTVANADLLDVEADVLAVKYAQGFHASDGLVADRLAGKGVARRALEAPVNAPRFTPSNGALKAAEVLFLGTVPLSHLGYHDVRLFGSRALEVLKERGGVVRTLALTVHGANCGLDEGEAVLALAGGLIDGIQRGQLPPTLQRITIVEKREARAKRLFHTLVTKLPGLAGVSLSGEVFRVEKPGSQAVVSPHAPPSLPAHGVQAVAQKPHAFVAMPFAPEFEDVFHYGIQNPVHAAGLLCERVDAAVFEGLIIQRILSRIASARVVVAELSGANPNVYLEVGYAWASKVPTVLLVRDVNELRFDVKGHRCLVYRNIRELEVLLAAELKAVC
jgi:hypothetical protein